MQVEIVGHDGGAEDADGDVEHGGVGDDPWGRNEQAAQGEHVVGMREEDLDAEHREDGADEDDDQGFDPAESPALEEEDEQDVEAGDEDAVEEGDMEQELEGDGRADDFGEIAGGDGDLGKDPESEADALAVDLVTELGEIAFGGNAEFEGEALQKDRHEVRQHDDEQKRVAETGAAGDIGGPVAGVHVADGDEEAGAEEAKETAPVVGRAGDADAGVDLRQRGLGERLVDFDLSCHRDGEARDDFGPSMAQGELIMVN